MDDATAFEFKLLVAGLLMLLGGLTDQSARYADE